MKAPSDPCFSRPVWVVLAVLIAFGLDILASEVLVGYLSPQNAQLTQVSDAERLVVGGSRVVFVQKKQKKKRQTKPSIRAKKPDFSKAGSAKRQIYFDDILKEGLAGPLPELPNQSGAAIASGSGKPVFPSPATGGNSGSTKGNDAAATGPFDPIISSATIENQVKKTVNELSRLITTPRKFKTEYNKAHLAYTKLSIMFGVNEVMGKEVRWHSQAAKLRVALAKTAASCRVGTPQAFQAAKQSLEDLKTVLSGSKASLPDATEPLTEWDTVADRGPLMEWLEELHQKQVRPYASSEASMKKNKDSVKENAEVLAVIAKVLMLPEMEGYDDEDYLPHAKLMLDGAVDVSSGLAADDFQSAIKGVNRIEQSCANCHEDYR